MCGSYGSVLLSHFQRTLVVKLLSGKVSLIDLLFKKRDFPDKWNKFIRMNFMGVLLVSFISPNVT